MDWLEKKLYEKAKKLALSYFVFELHQTSSTLLDSQIGKPRLFDLGNADLFEVESQSWSRANLKLNILEMG